MVLAFRIDHDGESMNVHKPRVSLGMPVFNGEEFIKGALNSILTQTYSDFELIISDNASTDRTQETCEVYAAKDPRIRYYRQQVNIGAGKNFDYVFNVSSGEYFKWLTHDDLHAPEFLAKCVEVLDKEPSVVLCFSKIVNIDHHGVPLTTLSRNIGASPKAFKRFRSLTSMNHACEEIFGLIRVDILRKTKLMRNYTNSDRTLLSELGLYGRFYHVPEPLFYHRLHPGMSTQAHLDWRRRMAWFDPTFQGRIVFPHWMQCADYFKTITRVPMSLYERSRCYLEMGGWLVLYGRGLLKDLLVATAQLVRRPFWRPGMRQRRNNKVGSLA